MLYHLLPWMAPATYFLEMNPLSANRPDSRLAKDVGSADWLVLNALWTNSGEPNKSTEPGPSAPNDVIRERFSRRAQFGPYQIFGRRKAQGDQPSS
jgi:hypothetical protein